ncbi:MAG: valine--tRNA ligase [Hyphomonadaceae bacterium]|nr:valine--tRNA ligase [Hyphomonadaceae bacterium]
MLDTTFDPKAAEARIAALWERAHAFAPVATPGADPYCIVIPPPNVTGTLHIGHALNNTLQDVLIRFERMRGKAALWQPGLDHAGIATQMVVERQLAEDGAADRRTLGREEFVQRVWAWKDKSGGQILQQLKRLGCSADWSRERFTMDEGLSAAVRKVFVQLHREGLIYRDKRLVNWDPHFETAISDLEVVNTEVNGHFWHFRYPLENGETYDFPIAHDADGAPTAWETRDYIAIATTRPETMLGDGAVAVHPSDKRYAAIVGKRVRLPLADRLIPIIADEYPDPDFGSGAVKITGAHDFNDYRVARRHDLPLYALMDTRGRMMDADYVPAKYRGLDRFEARRLIVADIEALGLLDRVEDKKITQPMGDRSGVVIEPMLTDQWYVDAPTLAIPAVKAVEEGRTVFTPRQWEKTYFEWMRNIEPWCVSRQLWWGHRIPAWYGPDGTIFVEETESAALAAAKAHYGRAEKLVQDEDVLDTWFSSGLWPFSTLGWPESTAELKKFYPTATLVTAFDIIFFWVARMMMLGLHFMKEVPFRDVYIHALVRDASGAKMSKSKGNVLDPLTLVDKFGADALRFTLAAMAAQGRDIKLSEPRIEGYRNFGTKLWNAARFCQMNECAWWEPFDPAAPKETVNRWIVGETARTAAVVTGEIEAFRFNEAAGTLYRFVWNVFCDWYLELVKPLLAGEEDGPKIETRRTAAWVLDRILMLLHPFMPFMTEELWERLSETGPKRGSLLVSHPWPDLPDTLVDAHADAEIDWIIRLVSETRALRAAMNVPPAARIPLLLVGAEPDTAARLERYQDLIDRLARLEYSTSAETPPPGAVTFVLDEAVVALPLEGVVDFAEEIARLGKEIARLNGEAEKTRAKLSNAQFIERAPEEVVEEQRERLAETEAAAVKLAAALDRLKAAT